MTHDAADRHAFISYVREDADQAKRLQNYLQSAAIPYWLDRESIEPGQDWKVAIRQAIRTGSMVFLACFSEESIARDQSYQNEEITIAIEEFRKLPPNKVWIIPIRFGEVEIPDWTLGAGKVIGDLNRVDLFGADEASEAVRLVTQISNIMGRHSVDQASVKAALESVSDADRATMLNERISAILLDSSQKITLSQLVTDETKRVITALSDAERFPQDVRRGEREVPAVVQYAERAEDFRQLIEPLAMTFATAAKHGDEQQVRPWLDAIGSIADHAEQLESGVGFVEGMRRLRQLPALILEVVGATIAVREEKWWLLRRLATDTTVKETFSNEAAAPLVTAVHPWRVFNNDKAVPQCLYVSHAYSKTIEDAFASAGGYGQLYCPIEEWLARALRPLIDDGTMSDTIYNNAVDLAIVWLGIVSVDQAETLSTYGPGWYGRAAIGRGWPNDNSVIDQLRMKFISDPSNWPPIVGGLFGGDPARAEAALAKYTEKFDKVRSERL